MALRSAVLLIAFSGLMFEIGLTRIYSATIWYHFTFVAVSVALLGWGLGGLAVHLTKRSMPPSIDKAATLCVLCGITTVVTLGLVARFPFTIDRLPMYFVAPLLPFLLAGMALSMIFDLHRRIAPTLYFFDLLGASLGAVSVTLLLQLLGGEAAVLVAAAVPFGAAALLSRKVRVVGVIGVVVIALAAFTNEQTGLFRVIPGSLKAMRRQMDANPGSHVAQTGWNAYSRIDAVEGVSPQHLARLYIDSDAWTSIEPWDGRIESVRDMKSWYRTMPFRFTPNADTLIIGPGGGPDVVGALASGSRKVTAVELNPLMLRFVRHYGDRAGNIYDRPDVEVIQSEGRNFISRTDRKFDIILLGFVDSWASVASGGLSLSENYLYTTQAFRAYYDHLKDDGILCIIRWESDVPRLISNSVALLGAEEASNRVVALLENRETSEDDPQQMLFMLRKRPFTPAETDEIVNQWKLATPIVVPGHVAASPYDVLLNGQQTLEAWDAASPTRVGAVFDDSPFYFAIERPWGMARRIAGMLFYVGVLPVLILLAVFIAFGKPKGQPVAPYAGSVLYFAALGFGFISVELALLQNLTLLIGHPIFTLSVLLFTLLAFGGIGSALSGRVPIATACIIVACLGIAEAFALPVLVPSLLPLGLAARIAIAIGLIAPLGLVMGMPFPRGLQHAGQGPLPAPPFFWGLNGIMSVIGSVTTVFVALSWGFQAAMLIGASCYILAALASRSITRMVVR